MDVQAVFNSHKSCFPQTLINYYVGKGGLLNSSRRPIWNSTLIRKFTFRNLKQLKRFVEWKIVLWKKMHSTTIDATRSIDLIPSLYLINVEEVTIKLLARVRFGHTTAMHECMYSTHFHLSTSSGGKSKLLNSLKSRLRCIRSKIRKEFWFDIWLIILKLAWVCSIRGVYWS